MLAGCALSGPKRPRTAFDGFGLTPLPGEPVAGRFLAQCGPERGLRTRELRAAICRRATFLDMQPLDCRLS
jgi:hypothetical protein